MNRTIHALLSLALAATLVGACSKKRGTPQAKAKDAAQRASREAGAASKSPILCGSTKACKRRGLCIAVKGRCVADPSSCRASERCKYLGYCGFDVDRCARFSLPICRKGANEHCKARFGDGYSCKGGACSKGGASAALKFPSKLTPRAIQQVVAMYSSNTRGCYTRRLLRAPRLGGTLRVDFAITTEGKPDKVSVAQSTFEDETLGQCVAKAVRAMRFPAPKKTKQVKYPFIFSANLIKQLQILVAGKPLLRVDSRGVVHQGDIALKPMMVAGKEIWIGKGMVKLRADGSVVDATGKPLSGVKINARGELSLAGKVVKIAADGKVIGGAAKPVVQVKGAKTALDKQAAMLLYVYNVLPRLGGKKK